MDDAAVIDTAGFLSGHVSLISHGRIYTVKEVIEEILDSGSRKRLETLLNANKVTVIEPSADSIREAREIAMRENILEALSRADQMLIALAIDLKKKGYRVAIFTDDSYLHSIARRLGIKSYGARRGIPAHLRLRIYYCEVCGYSSRKRIEKCPICGSKVREKLKENLDLDKDQSPVIR
jgi:rRNA maturation endonuclease Nob1